MVVGLFYREQKHICGKGYDTAAYMEVDLYPVSAKKHKASRRAKKKEASSLAQQTYNDKRAKRYHVQLVNATREGDFSWTGTYDDDHLLSGAGGLPEGGPGLHLHQAAAAGATATKVQRPKWVAATRSPPWAGMVPSAADTHYAIIQHTEGLTRDVLEGCGA